MANKNITEMITFNILGYEGRFGNQMFQYATLVGITEKIGCKYGINYQNAVLANPDAQESSKYLELLEAFDLSAEDISGQTVPTNKYQPRWFHFDASAFDIRPNTDISGYFQTEKYFKHCRDKVLSEFQFKPAIKAVAKKQIAQLKEERELVSIHVRRGDYVSLPGFKVCDLNYYNQAMSLFRNAKFIVFSNDIDWCKKYLIGNNIIYVEGNNQFVDMCMMSLCDHHIIANSSFSWWGAWLNENPYKKVVAPRRWFTLKLGNDLKDLYCEDWIIVGTWQDHLEYYFILLLVKLNLRDFFYSLVRKIGYFGTYPNRFFPILKTRLSQIIFNKES